jgi:predicted nucleotidyltransferase
VERWAADIVGRHVDVQAVGYFGSYARGDWGVGSDVDLVVIVDRTPERFDRRALAFDATTLPVPADVLVYTLDEWQAMEGSARFRSARDEMVWVHRRT